MEPASAPTAGERADSGPGSGALGTVPLLARGLIALGGIVAFVGFVNVGYGRSQPIPVVLGFADMSPDVAGGFVAVGIGVLMGFRGSAAKGLGPDVRETATRPLPAVSGGLAPIRTCPNCGVHTDLNVCPGCGHRVDASPGA